MIASLNLGEAGHRDLPATVVTFRHQPDTHCEFADEGEFVDEFAAYSAGAADRSVERDCPVHTLRRQASGGLAGVMSE